MDPADFFGGAWSAEGIVFGPFRRITRRFSVDYQGSWSAEQGAFYTEEIITYEHGPVVERHWVITPEPGRALVGYDASQTARLRAAETDTGFTVQFDRPKDLGKSSVPRSITLRFRENGPGRLSVAGETRLFGLVVGHAALWLRRRDLSSAPT